jgi:hypothetical protein
MLLQNTFFLYAGISGVGFLLFLLILPETKVRMGVAKVEDGWAMYRVGVTM